MSASRIAVIIATQDRAGAAAALVARLADQSRPPDHVFVLGSKPGDVEGVDATLATTCVMPANLAGLRRRGAALAEADHDILVFFDDAFLPSRNWLAEAGAYLDAAPEACAVSGIVLTSGRAAVGMDIDTPSTIVAMLDDSLHGRALFFPTVCLDGGNMAVRRSALRGLDFQEIPAHSLEFSAALSGRGRIGKLSTLFGMRHQRRGEPQGRGTTEFPTRGAAVPNPVRVLPRAAFQALSWIWWGLGAALGGMRDLAH